MDTVARPAVVPQPPRAGFALPWDDAAAPPPVAALGDARARLGDTFVLDSGADRYLFLFSAAGLRAFYALAERDASKGLADYRMLLRKLPPELFDGRRTFAHDLFGAQDVESYLDCVDGALDREVQALGAEGSVDAFALARRLGHRLGVSCWVGPEVGDGPAFTALASDLDALDGADAFVHPGSVGVVRATDYATERAALARVEDRIGGVLREHTPKPDDFVARIAARWDGTDEPARTRGIAYDVVLLHIATMTNLVAALGWCLVQLVIDPEVARAAATGDRGVLDAAIVATIQDAQGSIMMRTVLRPVTLDDGVTDLRVEPGTILATMLPVTNHSGPADLATAFGLGVHRCPARRFSMSAIARALERLVREYELTPTGGALPTPLAHQIGGVARPASPFPFRYRSRTR